jgi:hypothetical protein
LLLIIVDENYGYGYLYTTKLIRVVKMVFIFSEKKAVNRAGKKRREKKRRGIVYSQLMKVSRIERNE